MTTLLLYLACASAVCGLVCAVRLWQTLARYYIAATLYHAIGCVLLVVYLALAEIGYIAPPTVEGALPWSYGYFIIGVAWMVAPVERRAHG